MSLINQILQREAKFFSEMFIEDPLFLELEDIAKCYEDAGYCTHIIIAIPEKDVRSFLNKLNKATEYLKSIYNATSAEEAAPPIKELYERSDAVLSKYTKLKSWIHYPQRFREL